MLRWDRLESWITPEDQFFTVQHYGVPEEVAVQAMADVFTRGLLA